MILRMPVPLPRRTGRAFNAVSGQAWDVPRPKHRHVQRSCQNAGTTHLCRSPRVSAMAIRRATAGALSNGPLARKREMIRSARAARGGAKRRQPPVQPRFGAQELRVLLKMEATA